MNKEQTAALREWEFMLAVVKMGCHPNPARLSGERRALAEEIEALHARHVAICEQIEAAVEVTKAATTLYVICDPHNSALMYTRSDQKYWLSAEAAQEEIQRVQEQYEHSGSIAKTQWSRAVVRERTAGE
jgi:hypothetical protein